MNLQTLNAVIFVTDTLRAHPVLMGSLKMVFVLRQLSTIRNAIKGSPFARGLVHSALRLAFGQRASDKIMRFLAMEQPFVNSNCISIELLPDDDVVVVDV